MTEQEMWREYDKYSFLNAKFIMSSALNTSARTWQRIFIDKP